ncbi:hypothetical protein [Burkholderia gladioli]|uniref:hypothetical protein n=1 Tax=Burkholderia gladioli TaxID=28095 RepID=UPI001640F4BB|nr:hypothetical protein [Burkholderia gladioli]
MNQKPEEGMPLASWRTGGTRDFSGWTLGKVITDIREVSVDDILLVDSEQFNALNLCRVTEFPAFPPEAEGSRFYATFVSPQNTEVGRLGAGHEMEFCVWDFDLQRNFGNRYYRVHRTVQRAA